MAAPKATAKKKANSQGKRHHTDAGPGRYSIRTLRDKATGMGLRASRLRGRAHRLACRIECAPKSKVLTDKDFARYTYRRPGSLNVSAR